MKKPKEKIILESKFSRMGQYGGSEDDNTVGEFEVLEDQREKYSKSIGALIISFSELEDSVDRDFASSINERSYEPGYRIIKYLEFRDKINLLRDDYIAFINAVCPDPKKPRLLAELRIIYLKLVELSEFRNRVAHANWASLDDAGFVSCKIVENKLATGIGFEKVKITPGVMIKFIRQNNAVSRKLSELREKIWEADRIEQARRESPRKKSHK
jgi:hypothetical protein